MHGRTLQLLHSTRTRMRVRTPAHTTQPDCPGARSFPQFQMQSKAIGQLPDRVYALQPGSVARVLVDNLIDMSIGAPAALCGSLERLQCTIRLVQ